MDDKVKSSPTESPSHAPDGSHDIWELVYQDLGASGESTPLTSVACPFWERRSHDDIQRGELASLEQLYPAEVFYPAVALAQTVKKYHLTLTIPVSKLTKAYCLRWLQTDFPHSLLAENACELLPPTKGARDLQTIEMMQKTYLTACQRVEDNTPYICNHVVKDPQVKMKLSQLLASASYADLHGCRLTAAQIDPMMTAVAGNRRLMGIDFGDNILISRVMISKVLPQLPAQIKVLGLSYQVLYAAELIKWLQVNGTLRLPQLAAVDFARCNLNNKMLSVIAELPLSVKMVKLDVNNFSREAVRSWLRNHESARYDFSSLFAEQVSLPSRSLSCVR